MAAAESKEGELMISLGVVTDFRGYHDPDGTYKGPDWTPLADRAVGMIEVFTNMGQPLDLGICHQRALEQGWRRYSPLLFTRLDPTAYTLQSAALVGARALYLLDYLNPDQIAAWL